MVDLKSERQRRLRNMAILTTIRPLALGQSEQVLDSLRRYVRFRWKQSTSPGLHGAQRKANVQVVVQFLALRLMPHCWTRPPRLQRYTARIGGGPPFPPFLHANNPLWRLPRSLSHFPRTSSTTTHPRYRLLPPFRPILLQLVRPPSAKDHQRATLESGPPPKGRRLHRRSPARLASRCRRLRPRQR